MQSFIGKKILRYTFILSVFLCFTNNSFAQSTDCQKPKDKNERLLCTAIVKSLNVEDSVMLNELSFVSRRVDFNGDGRDEVLVWIPAPNWGGTSGYPIVIFSQKRNGYRKLWDEAAWTPIILLKSKSHGWRDFAYQVGGGGADWQYVIVKHNGKSYKDNKVQEKQPEGELLIDKNWKSTVFGPIPKQ